MGFDAHEEEQSRLLRKAVKQAKITSAELWLTYFSMGGAVGEYEVDAYLQGLYSLPPLQRDLLARAANELIDALPALPHAPYAADLEEKDEEETDEAHGSGPTEGSTGSGRGESSHGEGGRGERSRDTDRARGKDSK
jgi:hypothetical protein